MNSKLLLPVLFLAAAMFFSCTMVPVQMMKPAEVNMGGARRVAVLDFGYPEQEADSSSFDAFWGAALERLIGVRLPAGEAPIGERLSNFVTDRLIDTLVETDYFDVISPENVADAMEESAKWDANPVEIGRLIDARAIIVGEITNLEKTDSTFEKREKRKNDEGESVDIKITYYKRRLSIDLAYRVINTLTGTVMATKRFSDWTESEVKHSDRKTLPAEEYEYRTLIEKMLPVIAKQLAPHTVIEYRTLVSDSTGDPEMGKAERLVTQGLYEDALTLFLEVWTRNQNPAAGINGAIMYEALGDIDKAVGLALEVKNATADDRGATEYKRLLRVKEEQKEVESQMQ